MALDDAKIAEVLAAWWGKGDAKPPLDELRAQLAAAAPSDAMVRVSVQGPDGAAQLVVEIEQKGAVTTKQLQAPVGVRVDAVTLDDVMLDNRTTRADAKAALLATMVDAALGDPPDLIGVG